jgi:hypothetical protein
MTIIQLIFGKTAKQSHNKRSDEKRLRSNERHSNASLMDRVGQFEMND